jgi:hypothetical protein
MNPYNNLQYMNHGNNALNSLMQGVEFGSAMRQQKQRQDRENAMDEAYRGIYAGDPTAVDRLAQTDPRLAISFRQDQQAQQQAQQKSDRDRLAQAADLLDNSTDEVSYQRNLGVARQLGLDVSSAPPNFNPEFIATQSAIAKAVLGNDPELPLIGQEVVLRGFQPGTPEFQQEIGRILKAKYSTVSTVPYQAGGGVAAYDKATGQATPVIVPEGSQPNQPSAIPPEAAAELQANPQTAAQFDEIFGPGAAARILGGTAGNGGGNFQ